MSDPQTGTVRVKIYDREYALRTSGDPERLQKLCMDLDRRMREAAEDTGAADTLKVAVLAALRLLEDLRRTREQYRQMDETVGRRSIDCVNMLDRFLG